MNSALPNLPILILEFLAFLLAISVHEAAHAWIASMRGDQTARMLGRMTLNPVRHIELFGSVIFPLLGLMAGGWLLGWAKPTPIDPRNLKKMPLDDILISLAGPISNLVLALLAVVALRMMLVVAPGATTGAFLHLGHPEAGDSFWVPLTNFAMYSLQLNVLLAVFNLIPIPPLDGSHILRHFLPESLARPYQMLYQNGMICLLLLIGAIYIHIPDMLFTPVMNAFSHLLPAL